MTDWFQVVRRDGAAAIPRLMELEDISLRGSDGGNLLHAAVAYSNSEAAIELIRRGVDVNAQDSLGKTPLHYACDYQNTLVASCLLEHGGNWDIADKHGNTPLWCAVFSAKGKYDLVQLLLKQGAWKIAGQSNNYGRSPIAFANQIGDEQLVRILSAE